MRLILAILVILNCVAVILIPARQRNTLREAEATYAAARPDRAVTLLNDLLQQKPCWVVDSASRLRGQIIVDTARAVNDAHDYPEAVRWLEYLYTSELPCAGYDAEGIAHLRQLPEKHRQYAAELEDGDDRESALRTYEEIAELYPWGLQYRGEPVFPDADRILRDVLEEETECRLRHATSLFNDGKPLAALRQLQRIVQEPRIAEETRERAADLTSTVIGEAAEHYRTKRQYQRAFSVLDQAKSDFSARNDLVRRVNDVRKELEREVFGRTLGTAYVKMGAPTRTEEVSQTAPHKAVMEVKNECSYTLDIVYRGPDDADLSLTPKSSETVVLEPGRYVIAMFGDVQNDLPGLIATTLEAGVVYSDTIVGTTDHRRWARDRDE